MDTARYRSQSFWHETAPDPLEPRAPLASDDQVDVAIVGAGYTGLWTAYYLKSLDPGLRIAIVEAEIAGFGASGRNGGWCLGTLSGISELVGSDGPQRDAGIRLQRAIFDTVGEIERVCEREKIDCHWARGGNVTVALAPAQVDAVRADVAFWRDLGFGEEDVRWLEPDECRRRVGTAQNLGGFFLAHCAAIHPTRLVRGLADVVEGMGVPIYERSPARSIEQGVVVTDGGRLRADTVVRATEGYSGTLRESERLLLPLHSMMIATEPLPEHVFKEIGLENRETFADPRRMVIYGQRTVDNRLAFGARGRYFYGSGVHDLFSADDPVFAEVKRTLDSLFPVLGEYRVTHRWGEPSVFHETGVRVWESIDRGDSAGRVAMWAKESQPRIWLHAPWQIWCSVSTPSGPTCRWSARRFRPGSASRFVGSPWQGCAGLARRSTPRSCAGARPHEFAKRFITPS